MVDPWLACVAAVALLAWWLHASWGMTDAERSRRDLVVVTAHFNEDLRWLLDSAYPVVVCDKPGADPMPFPADRSCSLGVNRGREASAYLKYIVSNYHRLPAHVAFIHGHEDAWHHKLPFSLLEALDRARIDTHDYISLNNLQHSKIITAEAAQKHPERARELEVGHGAHHLLKKLWSTHLQPILRRPFPEHLRFQCCAQFIVSSRAIRRHPKAVYQRLLDMVMDPKNGDERSIAIAMEFVWHMLFTGGGPDMCEGGPPERCAASHLLETQFYR